MGNFLEHLINQNKSSVVLGLQFVYRLRETVLCKVERFKLRIVRSLNRNQVHHQLDDFVVFLLLFCALLSPILLSLPSDTIAILLLLLLCFWRRSFFAFFWGLFADRWPVTVLLSWLLRWSQPTLLDLDLTEFFALFCQFLNGPHQF